MDIYEAMHYEEFDCDGNLIEPGDTVIELRDDGVPYTYTQPDLQWEYLGQVTAPNKGILVFPPVTRAKGVYWLLIAKGPKNIVIPVGEKHHGAQLIIGAQNLVALPSASLVARLKALRLAGRLIPMSSTYPSRSTVTGSVNSTPGWSAAAGQSDYTDLPARHGTRHSDPACGLVQLGTTQLTAQSARPLDTWPD